MKISSEHVLPQVFFKTSRSSGKGGQNVNKVSSKAELNFNFLASEIFDDEQKELLKQRLAHRMNAGGLVQVISEEGRSQYLNKQKAIQKLLILLENALRIQRPRKSTKPKKSAIAARLENKHRHALKKLNRGKKDYDL